MTKTEMDERNAPWYQQPIDVQIQVVDDRLGTEFPLPSYATSGAAAIDLRAMIRENLILYPDQRSMVLTGLKMAVPKGIGLVIIPRSGLGYKNGIVLANLVGLIDSDYRGQIMISAWNTSDEHYEIEPGARLCQASFVPMLHANLITVSELSDTGRGEGGFGHTGIR